MRERCLSLGGVRALELGLELAAALIEFGQALAVAFDLLIEAHAVAVERVEFLTQCLGIAHFAPAFAEGACVGEVTDETSVKAVTEPVEAAGKGTETAAVSLEQPGNDRGTTALANSASMIERISSAPAEATSP